MVTPLKKVPIHLQSAQNRLIIKNGTVVNDDGEEQVDIYIEDSVIRLMGNHLIIPGGTRTIDAAGKYVIPGGIDLNVHLQRPGHGTATIDDFYQGTKAALLGGTTMVVDMVVPGKEESLVEAYDKWRRWADEKVCCDYALKMVLPRIDDDTKQEMEELTSAEYGVNSFMIYMSGPDMQRDQEMIETFSTVASLGGTAMVRAENGDIVQEGEKKMIAAGITGPEGHAMAHSEEAEAEAVMRACVLANQVGCPLFLSNLTSSAACDIVRARRKAGAVLAAEVSAAGLSCDGSNYWNQCWRHAAAFVVTPPLREGGPDQLLEAAVSGESVDIVSSHHAAYTGQQKALGRENFLSIPNGVTGVEERMGVLWQRAVNSGKMSKTRFVEMTSATPAKLLNIYPQKGKIAVGSDADIVIWDPSVTRTVTKEEHLSKCDFNVFEGLKVTGGPEYVIFKGRLVTDQGLFRPMTGYGQFQPLPPFAPQMYNKIKERKEALVIQPVARNEQDMAIVNGGSEKLPPPRPAEDEKKETNQQRSSVDMTSHPQTPDFDDSTVRNSPSRSSVRVRAPPGGACSGFW